jgi:hypothetical protein
MRVVQGLAACVAALALAPAAAAAAQASEYVVCSIDRQDPATKKWTTYYSEVFPGLCKHGLINDRFAGCVGKDGAQASYGQGAAFKKSVETQFGLKLATAALCTFYDDAESAKSWSQLGQVLDEYIKSDVVQTGWMPGAGRAQAAVVGAKPASATAPAVSVSPPPTKAVEGVPEAAALNAAIIAENKAVQARNDASQQKFAAQQAEYRAAQAAFEAKVREQAADFEAAQRRHAEALKAWEAKVAACKGGDFAACQG